MEVVFQDLVNNFFWNCGKNFENCFLFISVFVMVDLKVSLDTYNFCYNLNYRGIIANYKHVSSAYNSLLFSKIFGLHLSIILL